MKNNKARQRYAAMREAVLSRIGFSDLVEWVKELEDLNYRQREHVAKRVVYCVYFRAMIYAARAAFHSYRLNVNAYYGRVLASQAALREHQNCYIVSENHIHTTECGICVECLGTGRTLLLFPDRKRGTRCNACNGTRIRSQAFEQSDFIEVMRDDLEGHLNALHEIQISLFEERERQFCQGSRKISYHEGINTTQEQEENFLQGKYGDAFSSFWITYFFLGIEDSNTDSSF